jgi:hypothetical protein
METSELERIILVELHKSYLVHDNYNKLKALQSGSGVSEVLFWNVVEDLKRHFYIQATGLGEVYTLTHIGRVHMEDEGLIELNVTATSRRMRREIVLALGEIYTQKGGMYGESASGLAELLNLDNEAVLDCVGVLSALGVIERYGNGRFKLTPLGISRLKYVKLQRQLEERFNDVSEMSAQPRGREFQKIFATAVERDGWKQAEGVRSSNEEMDVIVFKGREYYLVECKWHEHPVEADVIREIFGKLGNRIDVRGIAVSMSGFTTGAIKQAQDYAGQKSILCFGSASIESLMRGETTFDNLLDEKYKGLTMYKKILSD